MVVKKPDGRLTPTSVGRNDKLSCREWQANGNILIALVGKVPSSPTERPPE